MQDVGVLLWSDPYQSIPRSSKLLMYCHLQWITQKVTRMPFPLVFTLVYVLESMNHMPSNVILKRGFSDGLKHTYFNQQGRLDISVCQLMEDNQLAYFVNEVTKGHGSVWFMQFQDLRKGVFHFELAVSLGTWVVLNREKTVRPLLFSSEGLYVDTDPPPA